MTISLADLDAHEQPSEEMRAHWKLFSRKEPSELENEPRIDDPRLPLSETGFVSVGSIPKDKMAQAFESLGVSDLSPEDAPIIHHPLLPGLLILPNLIPESIQTKLLDLVAHRDLSNPHHQTNMHLHFNLPYPTGEKDPSFFSIHPDDPVFFTPKDTSVHKPQSVRQVLNRKLHWVTLGGQYDWTNRVYPDERPPEFPRDIAGFLQTLFPETEAQAAIVNFYTPGDSMMMHRDVSEETDKGLVSLSLGCDGLFMIAPSRGPAAAAATEGGVEEKKEERKGEPVTQFDPNATGDKKGYLLLRLRSGDAIYMSEESRYAWHGVPKVIKGSCPNHLKDWPATEDGQYEGWRGWMGTKRVNLNVRQMR